MKITWIFFLAFIVQSQSNYMQKSTDVQEYTKFLKDSVHGKPESPVTEELKDLQPEWERSGHYEGDIILTEGQIEYLTSQYSGNLRNAAAAAAAGNGANKPDNAVVDPTRLWEDGIVIYKINEDDFDEDQITAIKDAMEEIESVSCIWLLEKMEEDKNYINIKGDDAKGCASSVGFVGKGPQTLNLAPNDVGTGCFRQGTIIHEFLHALGFYHMQSTHNRDEYVKINWDKIKPGRENNFQKYGTHIVTNLGTEYDYGSVLHYSKYSFSVDGSKTIEPLNPTDDNIGQRDGMTETDILKLNKLYKCSEDEVEPGEDENSKNDFRRNGKRIERKKGFKGPKPTTKPTSTDATIIGLPTPSTTKKPKSIKPAKTDATIIDLPTPSPTKKPKSIKPAKTDATIKDLPTPTTTQKPKSIKPTKPNTLIDLPTPMPSKRPKSNDNVAPTTKPPPPLKRPLKRSMPRWIMY